MNSSYVLPMPRLALVLDGLCWSLLLMLLHAVVRVECCLRLDGECCHTGIALCNTLDEAKHSAPRKLALHACVYALCAHVCECLCTRGRIVCESRCVWLLRVHSGEWGWQASSWCQRCTMHEYDVGYAFGVWVVLGHTWTLHACAVAECVCVYDVEVSTCTFAAGGPGSGVTL
jgi:hypothetical protein